MNITVYTVSTGSRSDIRPPTVIEPGVEYLAFVDDAGKPVPAPYRALLIAPDEGITHPGRLSRLPKILAHRYLPPDTGVSLYHDASLQLRISATTAVQRYLHSADLAIHRHPCRNCVYDEAEVLLREGIGVAAEVETQVEHMRSRWYPPGSGLWACGIILREHSAVVADLERRWWEGYASGCERDQVSFPFALWNTRAKLRDIPGNVYRSPVAAYMGHRK